MVVAKSKADLGEGGGLGGRAPPFEEAKKKSRKIEINYEYQRYNLDGYLIVISTL